MRHGSLFSGIGGFDLAAEWMGWENVFHCEINKFCQKILKQNFPNTVLYEDITKTDFSGWRGKVDIITGGFPCQPYSQAGKRKGKADDRHLWPQMLRAIREIQPAWVVGENVPGLLNWQRGMVLAEIKTDLEAAGFEVFPPCILPACGKNAPHRRDRLWIVAYSNGIIRRTEWDNKWAEQSRHRERISGNFCENGTTADTESNRINRAAELENDKGQSGEWWRCDTNNTISVSDKNGETNVTDSELRGCQESGWQSISRKRYNGFQERWPQVEPLLHRGDDGLSNWVDRIKALGNAIVPQVAYEIFKAIELLENEYFI